MHKHMLIAGSLVLSGCLTTAEIRAPARPSATAAQAITGGEATAGEVPSDAQHAGNHNVGEGIQPHSASREYSREETVEAETARINAWINEVCPRFVGPASWRRCIRQELNAVNAGVPNGGRGSAEGTQTAPANTLGEDTIEWGETPAATRAESGAAIEPVAERSTQPPKDPAPHLPKPKNGERWLCGHSMSNWVLDMIKDGRMETPESTIVLTRESPRDQATV